MRQSTRGWTVFLVFAAAYLLSQFYRNANAVIAGDVSRELSLSPTRLGFMTSVFYGAFALAQFPLGSWLDRYGPRMATSSILLVGVAGSIIFAEAHSFAALVLGRALLGAGTGAVLMGAYVSFSRCFSPRRYAAVTGMLIGVGSLGAAVAAWPLAWYAGARGWREAFLLGGGLMLASAVSIALFGGGKGGRTSRAAKGGGLAARPVQEETRSEHLGRRASPSTQTGGRASLGRREGFREVFTSVSFWRLAPLNLFMVGAFQSMRGLWAGPFLFDVAGQTPLQAGHFLVALSLAAAVGYPLAGWLAGRYGAVLVLSASTVAFALAQGGFMLLAMHPSTAGLWVEFTIFGFVAAFQMLLLVLMQTSFPGHLMGHALTAVNSFGFIGATALQWGMGGLIGLFGKDAAGRYPPLAYFVAFSLLAAGMVASLGLYLPFAWSAGRRGPGAARAELGEG